jgi:dipeptidyl-peptidase-4
MSALAVMVYPSLFTAAFSGAPVADWKDYDTCYTERVLGLPLENEAAYEESSVLTYAPNLLRPLLLVHGFSDDNGHMNEEQE